MEAAAGVVVVCCGSDIDNVGRALAIFGVAVLVVKRTLTFIGATSTAIAADNTAIATLDQTASGIKHQAHGRSGRVATGTCQERSPFSLTLIG